jgi:hypothetical protein
MALTPRAGEASEVGQGEFFGSLIPNATGCVTYQTTALDFWSQFAFDDKEFVVNLPPGNNLLHLNFHDLGIFHSTGVVECVFDIGGTFTSTATNEAGDFTWIDLDGEYLDHKPGIGEGDPFPWVASARCVTTRTDDFKTLCDNFVLSWNGLSKMKAPNPGYNEFDGQLNVRTAPRVQVDPNPGDPNGPVDVGAPVDGPTGHVPDIAVRFRNGVLDHGELSVATLADAHGVLPHGLELPVRGTTEIDHGSGPEPFFPGGDERFIEIHTNAPLPAGPDIEVCLPMPAVTTPADIKPVRVLHGEERAGGRPEERTFVDRTSRIDHANHKACAKVSSFSKFAVATRDVCGNGQALYDGIVTIAGGMIGRKNVIVDGLTNCANYPAKLPKGLKKYCVPDADAVAGQCSASLKIGLDRAGCNRVPAGVDPHAGVINRFSYSGAISGPGGTTQLGPMLNSAIHALPDDREATVGPATVALPVSGPIAKYKFSQTLQGQSPGSLDLVFDRDSAIIMCIDPSRY